MRLLSCLLVSYFTTVHCVEYYDGGKWHCGINKLTETISEWLAKPFDYHGVNQCCLAHDNHYYHHTLSRDEADRVFCGCLEDNANWFVRNLIEPIFCKSVQTYAIWQRFTDQYSLSVPYTEAKITTTTPQPASNYYLNLLRQHQLESELRKQESARKREEFPQKYEKFSEEWAVYQLYRR